MRKVKQFDFVCATIDFILVNNSSANSVMVYMP